MLSVGTLGESFLQHTMNAKTSPMAFESRPRCQGTSGALNRLDTRRRGLRTRL
jgi:hypothetical protein